MTLFLLSILLFYSVSTTRAIHISHNVALDKPTEQSSTGWDGLSSRAVDGNTSGNYWDHSITHTDEDVTDGDVNPWWSVDLEEEYSIAYIQIFNRQDCCWERLANYVVEITKNGSTVWTHNHEGNASPFTHIDVKPPIVGDGVKVWLRSTTGILSLAEVQVHADKVTDGVSPVVNIPHNVAFRKLTHQSSTGWGGSSSRAVDGNTSGNYWAHSITHTNEEVDPWWNVDFQEQFKIAYIQVFNRQDCCSSRLQNFIVEIIDGDSTVPTFTHTGHLSTFTHININPPALGDGVKVWLRSTKGILSLAEVKVYATRYNPTDTVLFEKFAFPDASTEFVPSYPLSKDMCEILRTESNSISVMLTKEDCDIDNNVVKNSLQRMNLFPPARQSEREFWIQFKEVIEVQALVKQVLNNPNMADPLHTIMPEASLPEMWKDYGIRDISKAVHDEFPGVYHTQLITKWLGNKELEGNPLIPKIGRKDFLRGPVLYAEMIGSSISLVGPCNFSLKWDVGRARPEEVAWKIKTQVLTPPTDILGFDFLGEINNLGYDNIQGFTDYDEGSPNHPSWPAMHSAASAASYWLSIVANLTEKQLCEARKLDYAISYARTVAGVHYPDDNISGLIVGQEILLQKLPEHLHKKYGADKTDVHNAMVAALYNWNEFKTSPCYKGEI